MNKARAAHGETGLVEEVNISIATEENGTMFGHLPLTPAGFCQVFNSKVIKDEIQPRKVGGEIPTSVCVEECAVAL